jgi:glycosyltransferase involved in cell wall biosynthesis
MQAVPFFSVIIPVYNRAHLIEQTLESVFNQTFTDYEVIVVDDGSTDESLAVLENYAGRIQVLTQANAGPGSARNLGIEHASGDYIAFLDSDDLWFPWTLETHQKVIEKNGRISFLSGEAFHITEATEMAGVSKGELSTELYDDYYESAVDRIWIGTCGAVVLKDALDRNGGFESKRMNAEDSDLWLTLGCERGFAHIGSPPVFAYRRQDVSAISEVDATILGIRRIIDKEKKYLYPGGKGRAKQRQRIIMCHVRPMCLACLYSGNVLTGWTLYRRTFIWNLKLCRFRFLLGFAALFIRRLLSGK